MFINRENELATLEEQYASGQASLFILYGRRRVGKTGLLRRFCQDKRHVFFVATLTSNQVLLAGFSRRLWTLAYGQAPPDFSFPNWEAAFQFLSTLCQDEPLTVVLDEFPYLINANPAVPSVLQKVWDETLCHTRAFLILCGSSISMMEQETLGYRSPLYGRRSGQWLLEPLEFQAARQFFPRYSLEQQVEAWAILGGVPAYLQCFNDAQSIEANVKEQILRPGRFLYEEPQFLLMAELREPRNYFAVLQAIAQGNTRPNAIAQASGVGDARTISKYLAVLRDLRFIEREVPITETQPHKSRRGIHRLCDPFLRFWFRYAIPSRGELDQGQANSVWETRIAPTLADFTGPAFEIVARQMLWRWAKIGRLPFTVEQVGSWWTRHHQVDVVALSRRERALLVGECKWRVKSVGTNVLDDLKRAASPLVSTGEWEQVTYALFSKTGFTDALLHLATTDPTLLLFDLKDLVE